MHRFALGILLAAVVAFSRPVATGGAHDLLAVGVVVEEVIDVVAEQAPEQGPGKGMERKTEKKTVTWTVLSVPTREAVEAFDALLRTQARAALLQGSGVHAPAPSGDAGSPRIVELVFYGVRSRDGRSPVRFDGTEPLPGSEGAWRAAQALAKAPAPVTASAARVLLGSRDVEAVRDALEALAAVRADVAVTEALAVAEDAARPPECRIVAIRVLKSKPLGGKARAPEAFRRLAADADPLVAGEAGKQ